MRRYFVCYQTNTNKFQNVIVDVNHAVSDEKTFGYLEHEVNKNVEGYYKPVTIINFKELFDE